MSSATEPFFDYRSAKPASHAPCSRCGFELWTPLWRLSASSAGLYDDARFAGRLIVSLGQHFDHLDDVPEDLLARFMSDVSRASRTLRLVLSVDRVNVAVLGNQESHVHAHLIPRRRTDADPTTAPWQDPRPRQRLASHEHSELVALLRSVVPW